MKLATSMLAAAACVAFVSSASALDWISLHEKADRLSLADARAAVAQNPDSDADQYVVSLVCLNEHKDAEALAGFEAIAKRNPGAVEAQWGIAEVKRRQHNLQESKKILDGVITARPDFSPAYITRAYIQYLELDFSGSVQTAQKVIRQGRGAADLSNYVRAYCLVAGGKGMLAHNNGPLAKLMSGTAVLPNLKKAQALKPQDPAVLFGLGSFYFLAPPIAGGDRKKAVEYLEQTIKVDPLFADAYVRLSQIYAMQGDKLKVRNYLATALTIDPQNALALDAQSKRCAFICFSMED